ncbi:dihydrofolate reductase family protein [Rhodococcus sp. 077-4]|uniref:dihydrofolate reductase family protein n=1 Tax=Rhodococcus sp. 077-4 TaxID=2789271 RepID=UPI0039F496E7
MRKLVYYIAVTLDGFIAAPDGTYDSFLLEGDHLEAIRTELPETLPVHVRAMFGLDAPPARFDTVVMGRETLQPALDAGIPSPYSHLRQYVLSRTLAPTNDPAPTIVNEDPIGLVRSLKAENSAFDVWLCGGGNLAGQLLPEIDELFLKVNPVVLGRGIGLFSSGIGPDPFPAQRFEHLESRQFESGVTFTRFIRTEPRTQ